MIEEDGFTGVSGRKRINVWVRVSVFAVYERKGRFVRMAIRGSILNAG